MRARRASKIEGCVVRLGNKLYDCISDYGWSFLRPLVVWLLFFFTSTGVYILSSFWASSRLICDLSTILDSLYLAFLHGIVLPGYASDHRMTEAYLWLFGAQTKRSGAVPDPLIQPPPCCVTDVPDIPVGITIFEMGHTLISAILIFLIVLGLRNQFKIQ